MPNPRQSFKLGTANAETALSRHSTGHLPTGTRCGREVPFVSNAGEEMGLTEVKWCGQWGTRYEARQSSPRVSAKSWLCSYTRGHLQNGGNKVPPKLVSCVSTHDSKHDSGLTAPKDLSSWRCVPTNSPAIWWGHDEVQKNEESHPDNSGKDYTCSECKYHPSSQIRINRRWDGSYQGRSERGV